MKNWVVVKTLKSPIQADIVVQYLRDNNVDALVINKSDSVYPIFNLAEIRVKGPDLALAQAYLSTFDLDDSKN